MPQRTPDHVAASADEMDPASGSGPVTRSDDAAVPVTIFPGRSPMLMVLSGPSGAGKDAVLQHLRVRRPDVHYAVSVTTRRPRPGEIPGISYDFVSPEEYHHLKDRGELLAADCVHGNWYGVPIPQIRSALQLGRDVLLKIDVQGAAEVRNRLPHSVSIFLAPPSFEEISTRLMQRRTESPTEFDRRVNDARSEMAQISRYDYVVLNPAGALGSAVSDIECIITAERHRVHREPVDLQRLDSYQP